MLVPKERMRELMIGTARAAGPSTSRLPLLETREEIRTTAVLAITGDRGLAGPFNSQILRRAFALERCLPDSLRSALSFH